MTETGRPLIVDGQRDVGPWSHDDGTLCEVFLAPRPTPEGTPQGMPVKPGARWWCTEHQQHLTVGQPAVRRLLAYRGKEGCRSVVCTRSGPSARCYGWHCATCDAPCSEQGHDCPAGTGRREVSA
jgi:hypothetical protein